ncbi:MULTISPECIES: hypothetical protein [unclassified Rhodococcus (in: high G+C Gram-positive bacteria)]|uniref:hypothetical protein n=1 Tax=unclassified Rhodococcus (in: high G+C Gram-positive bacteria) TaxID=192944 RepID=UPI001C9ADA66|nr:MULTISPECIES: hypothetical protein [unclassified Rhodococcus (in: high G+C Gram-positive bacteria)]MBY6709184.1 hypothetical protein [Rhodococcus sp. BP-241]
MAFDRYLDQRELFQEYSSYSDAHELAAAARRMTERGDDRAAMMTESAQNALSGNTITDEDALAVNAHISQGLLRQRHDIVTRLREQDPPMSWTRIGELLGMSKQAAHRWHTRGYLRPTTDNPSTHADEQN